MSRGAHKVGPGIAGDEPVYSRQETEVTSSRETFDLEDERGRVIGFRSWIFECSYTPANGYGYRETPRFIARTQATRNGEKFGALTPEIHADTLEAALAAVKKRRDDSFRRYARRFSR